ncbi:hypothetical protein DL96DRAFT_1719420 [Flagelloscypha sp. PMI_526]|nr:hypothetical protein DL96DRAFT_1719420 [Flagelloscypha sp. PMI_526]
MPSMILSSKKDAPNFHRDSPEKLGRFFRLYEKALEDAGITDEEKKISLIVDYVDPDTEYQWKAIKEFGEKNYEKFKKAVEKLYPEAQRTPKGALARLGKLKSRYNNIDGEDTAVVAEYNRSFMAEWHEIKDTVGNRTGVNTYLGCISPDFASEIIRSLNQFRAIEKATNPQKQRDEENIFTLEEVMEKALELSENMNDSFGLMFEKNKFRNSNLTGRRTLVKQEPESTFGDLQTMQQEISTLKDTLEVIEKNTRSNNSELKEHFEQLFKRQSVAPIPGIMRPPAQFSNYPTTCLYCDQSGHMLRQCLEKAEDLRTGKIQMNAMGRIVLADGSPLDQRAPLMNQVRKPPSRVHFVESQFTNEFAWTNDEPEASIQPVSQFYHAPTLEKSSTEEKLDKLTGEIEKMTLLMSSMMSNLINTRKREYGDPYEEK